jgi:hypothetical protein
LLNYAVVHLYEEEGYKWKDTGLSGVLLVTEQKGTDLYFFRLIDLNVSDILVVAIMTK